MNESVKSEGDPNCPNAANGIEQNEVIFAQPQVSQIQLISHQKTDKSVEKKAKSAALQRVA